MNKEASRGNLSKKSWPLDVLFHYVLRFCEKEIMANVDQNLPPLIYKKMFLHTIYRVRVRLARLFVVYKWNLKQIQVQQTPDYKNSYFSRLQLSVTHLQNTCNYFHGLVIRNANFNINMNQIEKPKFSTKIVINSNEVFKNKILQTKMHKSVTGVQSYHNKLIIFSKDKYQFSIKFSKTIQLLHFRIYCSKEIDVEPIVKKVAQNCNYILNNSSHPLYHCCEYLEKIYMYLYFTLVCKKLQSYKEYHKFTINNINGNVTLNFYELRMKFSLILLQSSVAIFSNDNKANIKFTIEKVEDLPTILSKVQRHCSIYLFTQFGNRIKNWLILSKCFSTYVDHNNYYFYFLIFNYPISKISYNSANELYCDHPQLLTSLLTNDDELFLEYIKNLEIRIIAESTGFLNLVLYDDLMFKRALKSIKENQFSNKYLLFFRSTNNFLRKIFKGDNDTISLFKQIMTIATRSIVYQNLSNELIQNNIYSAVSEKEMIISTNAYGHVRFKISSNGYWSLQFDQSNILHHRNMAIMFQGRYIYQRFGSLINNLISTVTTTANMIDQTFHQYKVNKSISVFSMMQKTALFFKGICPPLKGLQQTTSPVILNLQPLKFVGQTFHFDSYEILTSIPTIRVHFVNHPNLDFCVQKAIVENLIDQRFGSFLCFILPVFPHFFHIFNDNEWQIMDISLRGTFSLMYQSKYMMYFQQQAKNCFNVAIPHTGKSIILKIPLSIFSPPSQSLSVKKPKANSKKPLLIRVSMSDLFQLRDSILIFFNEQKLLKNYGFNCLLYNSKSNLIFNNGVQIDQKWVKMNTSLGADGLTFEVFNEQDDPAIDTFKRLLALDCSSRNNRIKVLKFLFDCLQIEKPTALGLFQCLECLLDSSYVNIDWEKSFLDSSVDVQNCIIDFHLILNNNDYKILIDSSQESSDSTDALVSVTKPNGDMASVQRLKTDLENYLKYLLNQASSEKVLYEFSFP